MQSLALLFALFIVGSESFSLVPAGLSLLKQKSMMTPGDSARRLRLTTTKASLSDMYTSSAVALANILLAVDSDESKTDNLYNGIPATGAVEVVHSKFSIWHMATRLIVAL